MEQEPGRNLGKSTSMPIGGSIPIPKIGNSLTEVPAKDISENIVDDHLDKDKAILALNKLLKIKQSDTSTARARFHRSASMAEFEPYQAKQTRVIQEVRLIKQIGKGSFGSVWKAENLKTEKTIAVKRMIGSSFQEQLTFLREAEILKLSNHPNVLSFLGLYIKKGSLDVENLGDVSPNALNEAIEPGWVVYLCTEYCRYRNLTLLLRNNKVEYIPWDVRIKLSLDIAKGLNHLHSMKVVHRDIKGENILLKPLKRSRINNIQREFEKQKEKLKMKQIKRGNKRFRGLGLKLGEESSFDIPGRVALQRIMSKSALGIKTLPRRQPKTRVLRKFESESLSSISTESSDSDTDSDFWSDAEEAPHYSTRHWQRVLSSRAILADVGLARFFTASVRQKKRNNNDYIREQRRERLTIRGNPWTMAPELLKNPSLTSFTTACDVFSLGVVFLEICTRLSAGQLPRASEDFSLDFNEINKLPVELRYQDPKIQEQVSHSVPTEDANKMNVVLERNSEGQTLKARHLFETACPVSFRNLAAECVHIDPEKRPASSDIVKRLDHILKDYMKLQRAEKDDELEISL